MQQIERYGVIALVFLLVTIVAVSFWGDSKSPGFWSRLTGRGAKKDVAAAQTQASPEIAVTPAEAAPATGERALQTELPLTTASAPAPTATSTAVAAPVATSPAVATTTQLAAAPPMPASTLAPASTPAPVSARAPTSLAASAPRPAPPVARAVSSAPATGSSTYTVQKGDSLMRIAAKTLGAKDRWTEIRDLNHGVDARSLHVGQKLVIPASASKAGTDGKRVVPAKKPAAAPEASTSDTYLVRKGDTLKSIAERHLGSQERWKEIAAANPKVDPHHLAVGMSLKVPRARAGVPFESKSEPALAAAMPRELPSSRPHVR
jgi:nucleoid-associated protein YgaU